MRSFASIPLTCVALVALGGCVYTSHKATLNPTLNLRPANVGGRQPVDLAVVDERPQETIGRRGAGSGIGASITTDQDLAALVRAKLEEGLKGHGFAISRGDAQELSTMKVEIRSLEYVLVMGFFSGSAQTSSAMKVACTNGPKSHEKLYRAEHKRGAFFVPSGDATDRMLNETLSKVLEKILEDRELHRCLAA